MAITLHVKSPAVITSDALVVINLFYEEMELNMPRPISMNILPFIIFSFALLLKCSQLSYSLLRDDNQLCDVTLWNDLSERTWKSRDRVKRIDAVLEHLQDAIFYLRIGEIQQAKVRFEEATFLSGNIDVPELKEFNDILKTIGPPPLASNDPVIMEQDEALLSRPVILMIDEKLYNIPKDNFTDEEHSWMLLQRSKVDPIVFDPRYRPYIDAAKRETRLRTQHLPDTVSFFSSDHILQEVLKNRYGINWYTSYQVEKLRQGGLKHSSNKNVK